MNIIMLISQTSCGLLAGWYFAEFLKGKIVWYVPFMFFMIGLLFVIARWLHNNA